VVRRARSVEASRSARSTWWARVASLAEEVQGRIGERDDPRDRTLALTALRAAASHRCARRPASGDRRWPRACGIQRLLVVTGDRANAGPDVLQAAARADVKGKPHRVRDVHLPLTGRDGLIHSADPLLEDGQHPSRRGRRRLACAHRAHPLVETHGVRVGRQDENLGAIGERLLFAELHNARPTPVPIASGLMNRRSNSIRSVGSVSVSTPTTTLLTSATQVRAILSGETESSDAASAMKSVSYPQYALDRRTSFVSSPDSSGRAGRISIVMRLTVASLAGQSLHDRTGRRGE